MTQRTQLVSYHLQIAKLVEEIHTLKFKIEQQSIFNENNRRQAQIVSQGFSEMGQNPLSRDPVLANALLKGQGDLRRNQQKLDSFLGEMVAEYQGKVAALEKLVEFQEATDASANNEMEEIRGMLDDLRNL